MRLIDADALKRKVLEWMPPDPCGREEKEYPFETDIVVSLMMEIEKSPTIDIDRPQGKRIDRGSCQVDEDAYDVATCSECNEEITIDPVHDNFCPNCGADMRGDTE